MKNKCTVTVGIPVYNEEENIIKLLEDILMQKNSNFTLEKILIVADASTDTSVEKVQKFAKKNQRVELMVGHVRRGKLQCLNQIYSHNNSDILVTFDGDIRLSSENVLLNLITCFNDPKVHLVSANDRPAKAVNLTQCILNTWFDVWFKIRQNFNNGDTVYNVHGNGTAMRKTLAQQITYPTNITADQDFIYLMNKKNGYEYRYALDAIILFRNPDNLHDYFLQATRFMTEKNSVIEYFGQFAADIYAIPVTYKIEKVVAALWEDPITVTIAFLLYFYFVFISKRTDPLNKIGMWEQAVSTKKAI